MYLRTEIFTENNVEMKRDFYGHIDKVGNEVITSTHTQKNVVIEETKVDELTQDEINAEILLNQTNIITKQEEQDQVLAEILLVQTGGL